MTTSRAVGASVMPRAWERASPRERIAITVAAVVVIGALAWALVWQPLTRDLERLREASVDRPQPRCDARTRSPTTSRAWRATRRGAARRSPLGRRRALWRSRLARARASRSTPQDDRVKVVLPAVAVHRARRRARRDAQGCGRVRGRRHGDAACRARHRARRIRPRPLTRARTPVRYAEPGMRLRVALPAPAPAARRASWRSRPHARRRASRCARPSGRLRLADATGTVWRGAGIADGRPRHVASSAGVARLAAGARCAAWRRSIWCRRARPRRRRRRRGARRRVSLPATRSRACCRPCPRVAASWRRPPARRSGVSLRRPRRRRRAVDCGGTARASVVQRRARSISAR